MSRVANLIYKSLTPKIAPMVYVMMFVSVLIGWFFLTGFDMTGNESILYDTGVLVHRQAWGAGLFVTASMAEIGFVTKNKTLISIGGLFGLSLWAFASITTLLAGHLYIFLTIALFHLLFHGYVVLANSLGVLERRAIMRP